MTANLPFPPTGKLNLPASPVASTGIQNLLKAPDGKCYRYDLDGWNFLHLEGAPRERGYAHGWLLADEIEKNIATQKGVAVACYGLEWNFCRDFVEKKWLPKISPEYVDVFDGMSEGLKARGKSFDRLDLLISNACGELTGYWWPAVQEDFYAHLGSKKAAELVAAEPRNGADDHCSAFMATGSYTKDGGIVAAHNSFTPYEEGNFMNVCIDVIPESGQRFIMQSQPGFIHSFTDFYESASLIVLETTIGGFCRYDTEGTPEFQRIRKAVQYAKTIDEFAELMLDGNNGGYANTWLIGELATGAIGQLELGLKFHRLDKKTDGYFVGFNAPQDPYIRALETKNSGFSDLRRHQGARQVRLPQLMEQYKGKIDAGAAQRILADHYDVYLEKENPCSRTVCSHYELDPRETMSMAGRPFPYQPRGAVDGVCATAADAKAFAMRGRWGSSCGAAFDAAAFFRAHPQFSYLKPYVFDRPSRPWTVLKSL